MKRVILLGIVSLCLVASSQAQANDEEVRLPDAVMKQVVGRIVRWYFKPRRKLATIYFSEDNLKKEWMPKIKGIKFVLVDGHQFQNGLSGYFIYDFERAGHGYTIGFGYGEFGCNGGVGVSWSFRVVGGRVRLIPRRYRFGWDCGTDVAPPEK